MKIRIAFLTAIAGAVVLAANGCSSSPPSDIPGKHKNNDVPIVVQFCEDDGEDPVTACEALPNPGLASQEFDLTFRVIDADSDFVMLWDECPFPDLEGATPILRIGYSEDGTNFLPIDPAHLQLDGAPLVVPTCSQVKNFSSDIRLAVTASGTNFVLTWDTLAIAPGTTEPYIPTAANVTVRIAVNDGSFTSDPGDTAPFDVANLPGFSVSPVGARPNQTLVGAQLSGLLTNWAQGTTVVGSADNISIANLTITAPDAATADITMGADTEQRPRIVELITPGAGIPSGDEVAAAQMWTCNELGSPVIAGEFPGAGFQYICDQGDFTVTGDLTEGDQDILELVAGSDGNYTITFDWNNGTDYDLIFFNGDGTALIGPPGPFGCGDCCSENKPETCVIPYEVGTSYLILIDHFAGPAGDYTLTADAP